VTFLTNSGRFGAIYPIYIAHDSNTAVGAAQVIVNVPTGTADGDVMIATFCSNNTGAHNVTLTGWTLIQDTAGTTPSQRMISWFRIASSEPASYTIDQDGGGKDLAAAIMTFRNANATQPDTSSEQYNSVSSANVDAATITATAASALVFVGGMGANNVTFTPPSGYTEKVDIKAIGTNASLTMAILENWSGGATGTVTATASASDESLAHLISVAP
jgi:hypothetical protein